MFLIGDRTYSGFVVRSGDQNGRKWLFGIHDSKKGRELLREIGVVYDLPKTNIIDKTQGEKVDNTNGG